MQEEIDEHGFLEQEYAAYEIVDKFGEEFVYENEMATMALIKRC
jgi:hypothetical protein